VAVSRLARWVPLAAVVVLFGLAMLSTRLANPTIDVLTPPERVNSSASPSPFDPDQTEPTLASATPLGPAALAIDLPEWLEWALGAACVLVVLGVAGFLVWLVLRDRVGRREVEILEEPEVPPTPEETEQTVRAAVDAGLADLDDADTDPRRAVIACWVRLEAAAAAAGTERAPGDTSTELVARLLTRHDVSAPVLAALAEVYREARFASHPVDEQTRHQARTALRQLRDELRSGVRHG
jgi:hypothetical protein